MAESIPIRGVMILPVRLRPPSMKYSMAVPFDTYLVDEVAAVGDQAFKAKSNRVFHERMRDAGAIVVSHSMGMLRRTCQAGAVLDGGKLNYYHDIEDAIQVHLANMKRSLRHANS